MRSLLEIYESITDDDKKISKRDDKLLFCQMVANSLQSRLDIDGSAFPAGRHSKVLPFAAINNFKGKELKATMDEMKSILDSIAKELKSNKIKVNYDIKTEDRVIDHTLYSEKTYCIDISKNHNTKTSIKIRFIFSSDKVTDDTHSEAILKCNSAAMFCDSEELKDLIQ